MDVLLHFPRYNSGCSAPPHHPKTSEESGRTSATPKGFRVGLGSMLPAETHLLGASAGTSWVSCCSSPSWPSLLRSLPRNCYVPVDHCAKQRDLIFGSAIPFSLFYTEGRKRSQVVQIFLLFLSQLEINYSKAWISSDWDTQTHSTLTILDWPRSEHLLFSPCSNTITLTELLCGAQGNLALHSSQGKTNILSGIINTGLRIVK